MVSKSQKRKQTVEMDSEWHHVRDSGRYESERHASKSVFEGIEFNYALIVSFEMVHKKKILGQVGNWRWILVLDLK